MEACFEVDMEPRTRPAGIEDDDASPIFCLRKSQETPNTAVVGVLAYAKHQLETSLSSRGDLHSLLF